MPVFQNRTAPSFTLCPEGEQLLRVVKFEGLIQTGNGITAGSTAYDVRFRHDPTGSEFTERLIDHPNTAWKIDNFLVAFNAKPPMGPFEFIKTTANKKRVPWIDPIGLQGMAAVGHRPYVPKTGPNNGKTMKAAEIRVFLTDKEKFPRHVDPAAPQPASAPEPAEDFAPLPDDVPF